MTKELTLDQLLAALQITNNGYLFAPSAAEIRAAVRHPEAVDIRNGQIHRKGAQPPHPAIPAPGKPHRSDFVPDFDFEGAILNRQERNPDYW
jgi:hypothetical protein